MKRKKIIVLADDPLETNWQRIEHRKHLELLKSRKNKTDEPEGMTAWQKIEHRKWVRQNSAARFNR